ncbi:hypothetical protein BS50DRAFT_635746 [Corynespora cassiicola Philippines]|uniref:Uncharacterized protein n=1 Tax=Corynespora cassiicola Philippines TaxID=1448308 RepID=A0A2T2NHJ1_CORCC|nr:hypothetical protein BS50DRAFT_635746 [Corynespora cassiicola Philippines]
MNSWKFQRASCSLPSQQWGYKGNSLLRNNAGSTPTIGGINTASKPSIPTQNNTKPQLNNEKHNTNHHYNKQNNICIKRMASSNDSIDLRVPGRVGCPILPPFPVENRFDRSKELDPDKFLEINGSVYDVLKNYSESIVNGYSIFSSFRVNPGVAADPDHLTLVIVANSKYEDKYEADWVEAVKKIRKVLQDEYELNWNVELIAKQLVYDVVKSFLIPETEHDLIQGWNKARPDFVAKIEEHDWIKVDVMNRGYNQHEARPTIVVSARDAGSDVWWNSTLPALHQVLKTHNLPPNVQIELRFLQGLSLMATDGQGTEPSFQVRENFYEDDMDMGTSCSTSQSNASGTLGGRIQLKTKSSVLDLGLTAYHVLKDGFCEREDFSGPFPPDDNLSYGKVVSPSDGDHTTTLSYLQEKLQEQRVKEASYNYLDYITSDQITSNESSWLSKLQHQKAIYMIRALEASVTIANGCDREVGQIFSASGFTTRDNPRFEGLPGSSNQHKDWALDWCLFHVGKPISCELKDVPSTAHNILGTQNNPARVTQYCTIDPNKNYKVMKRGRTSGWTQGTISKADSIICTKAFPKPKTPTNVRRNFEDGRFGKFVSVHTILHESFTKPFLEPGDSGSFVLLDEPSNNNDVTVAGLAFAADNYVCASYMIPFDLIVEDIEEVTGGKVIEPRCAGTV